MPIDSIKHQDKRANIPTEELRDFVVDDEKAPKAILYPRDPSLDPQLVWKGKEEQDAQDLEVESVPIYIQEKISPLAIIEDVRATARQEQPQAQLDLFGDFNGIEFENLIDFYQHEQNWANRMILGDSLLVMNSLAEKERLKGLVQMIYIDPPYGIKFGSNWQVSTRKRDVKDGKAEDVTRQPEQIKAFRDTWELGIHSYLSYLRDRLVLARELLTESGSVFVQIGDENVHLVRCLMDEVFGSENFCSLISVQKTTTATTGLLPTVNDYLMWYAKQKDVVKYRQLFADKKQGVGISEYQYIISPDGGEIRKLKAEEADDWVTNPGGWRLFRQSDVTSQHWSETRSFNYIFQRDVYRPGSDRQWSIGKEGLDRIAKIGRFIKRGKSLAFIRFLADQPVFPIPNVWTDVAFSSRAEDKIYVIQTSEKIITRCLLMTTDPGDLVLDPTCGSGTTAYVAEGWGRRWITIDTSRVALALARTRLMAAKYPYYLLADSPEGVQKEAEITGVFPAESKTTGDIKKGFVYERVPHITLKSIANNPEIDTIHEKWQEQLEPLRAEINRLAGKKWEEWEVPRPETVEESATTAFQSAIETWWELRRERQRAIDDAIARHADTEILYDKPIEDHKRIRVAGTFTVESLSPHRVHSTDEALLTAEAEASSLPFETRILDNLKKAGVQNTVKNERLTFDWLESYPGEWLHVEGEYTETDLTPDPSPAPPSPPTLGGIEGGRRGEKTKRVAVCIGPEHGTVGPELIKEAAKEAVHGLGFDLLIVCGFAFDPHVSEERTRYGKLTVLLARMNPDLAMGDELLKKTGAGNLFMVFGEPDVDIKMQKDGKIVVKIKGVDVYDPTTGMVRSNSTDHIACWFIDTNYNGESFFVRHAYFTGDNEPYDKLKRALRAEIDEGAWATLYRTESRPFEPPESGKIAVKVINHYGDEVLKVYDKSHWEM